MSEQTDFEKAAKKERAGLAADVFGFLKENKKWWLLPVVLMVLLLAALVILGSTGAGPFIYTLF